MGTVIEIRDSDFQEAVSDLSVLTLVEFTSQWCKVCQEMESIVGKLAQQYTGKLKVCRIDFDDNIQSAVANRVMVVPTLLFFKNGNRVERLSGAHPAEKLSELIDKHLL